MKKVFKDEKNLLRPGWQVLLSAILGVLTTFIAMALFTDFQINTNLSMFLICFISYFAYFKLIYGKKLPRDLDIFNSPLSGLRKFLIGTFLGVLFFSVVMLIAKLFHAYDFTVSPKIPVTAILLGLVSQFITGLSEELLVRGGFQHAFLKYGKWVALMAASIIFSLLHVLNKGAALGSLIGVFLAAIFLGMLMYATNSISACIGWHMAWNWTQGFLFGTNISGTSGSKAILQARSTSDNIWLTGGDFGPEASIACFIVLILGSLALFIYGQRKNKFNEYDRTIILTK
ncbi:CPBP family intramembrane glutamic endopeptidase [Enterococcus sp. DIV0800]|uniref:CPBP family intramembrane glutamic endopeptidase n=1 Tax=unclassified Enterococcus TaxID=2608891 RepID=UPI003D2FAE57